MASTITTTTPPPTSSPPSTYTHLLSLLHPSPPHLILEIEILPSSHPHHILSSPPALGIPKSHLLSSFLHARTIFLSTPPKASNAESKADDDDGKWKATKVLTLWEPNWYTAWAFRRRHLLALRDNNDDDDRDARLNKAVLKELQWTETLVTSSLNGNHAKSSWIWTHRAWLLRTFPSDIIISPQSREERGAFMTRELKIVMLAGERHARNYSAWEYARQAIRISLGMGRQGKDERETEKMVHRGLDSRVWEQCARMVHQWCLMHPRDISGWAFLVYIMDLRNQPRDIWDGDGVIDAEAVTKEIFQKTQDFVRRFEWKGESIEWFLRSGRHFQKNR